MSVLTSVNSAIQKYGDNVSIVQNEKTVTTKAFIQPLRYRNKMYINGEILPQGYYDGGHYLYIGLNTVLFDDNYRDTIIFRGEKGYIIKRAENYMVENKIIYVWAIVTPYIEPMEDSYD